MNVFSSVFITDLVSGDSIDWFYDVMNVNISLAIELRDLGEYGFLLPPEKIIPTSEELFLGITNTVKEF